MAKISDDPMTSDLLKAYLETCSDFAFEMEVLHALKPLPYQCEHSGTYIDSVTCKPREFDIRAVTGAHLSWFYLAIECKNLKSNSPLLITCMPRRVSESRHHVIAAYADDLVAGRQFDFDTSKVLEVSSGGDEPYPAGKPVGKSCAQVGRDEKEKFEVVGKDIYDRWSQSLSSARDMMEQAALLAPHRGKLRYSVVIPVVVVPDGQLWRATYGEDGTLLEAPIQVDRASYYVGHTASFGTNTLNGWEYPVSHVEFVTKKGLLDFAKWLPSENGRICMTPEGDLSDELWIQLQPEGGG